MLEASNLVSEMSRLQDRAPPRITCNARYKIQRTSLPSRKMRIQTKKNTIASKMPSPIRAYLGLPRPQGQLRKVGLIPNKLVE